MAPFPATRDAHQSAGHHEDDKDERKPAITNDLLPDKSQGKSQKEAGQSLERKQTKGVRGAFNSVLHVADHVAHVTILRLDTAAL